jgi:fumarylacetoacetase
MRGVKRMIDDTHDPGLASWIPTANGHPNFPIQNLPLGIFSTRGGPPRPGVAIGDSIMDLPAATALDLFSGDALKAAELCVGQTLNALMGSPPALRRALRSALSKVLARGSEAHTRIRRSHTPIIHDAAECAMHVPARIGGYSDFFAGIHHAVRAGKLLRAGSSLTPNYKYVPIGYNGRASTIGAAPARIRRPQGQIPVSGSTVPMMAPTRKLDYELELGIWIGQGNPLGQAIPIDHSAESIFGFGIFNDWSARDLQRWEAQPLGPFLGKSFASTITPWVITPEALAPFRAAQPPRPPGDPLPLEYLLDGGDQATGALDVELEVLLRTSDMRQADLPAERISSTNTLNLYWTPAQLLAHHTINGCILEAGDLLGSGTISGTTIDTVGCLLEQTLDGEHAIRLSSGEERRYLEDGDEVILRATCRRDGCVTIGFGDNRGEVLPASSPVERGRSGAEECTNQVREENQL